MAAQSRAKSIIKRTFPGIWRAAQGTWSRYRAAQWNSRLARITRAFVERHGWQVMGGPFQGMRYGNTAVCSALLPKLAGSYEAELHPLLASLRATDYDTVVDVGCAEGYYAVGFARNWPGVQVIAFDTDAQARELCAQMAEANGVAARVRVEGACEGETLRGVVGPRSLLISDCEGYELVLLQPDKTPELRDCDILVELHDCLGLEVRPVLCERFAASHDITILDTTRRNPEDYPALAFLSSSDRRAAVDEIRPPMQWAFMKSKVRARL